MINKALEKLSVELEKKHKGTVPAIPILNYLIAKVKESEELADRINLERKTVEKCFKYVLQEVKKLLNNANGWLDDQAVYDLAEKYFMSDDLEIDKPKPVVPKTTTKPTQITPKKEEKKTEEKESQISLF